MSKHVSFKRKQVAGIPHGVSWRRAIKIGAPETRRIPRLVREYCFSYEWVRARAAAVRPL